MSEKNSSSEIAEKYASIKEKIASACAKTGRNPDEITLLAATKTRGEDELNEIKKIGINIVGENKVQEFIEKESIFGNLGFTTHIIGHLQSNKVNKVVGKADYIDSIDSIEIADKISRRAEQLGIIQNVMVEVNIGNDEAKSGVLPDYAENIIYNISKFNGISVKGLMIMPPKAENDVLTELFSRAYKLFIDISLKKLDNVNMDFLSMGMSSDFETAIKCGSNMIRLGTALFGERNYLREVR